MIPDTDKPKSETDPGVGVQYSLVRAVRAGWRVAVWKSVYGISIHPQLILGKPNRLLVSNAIDCVPHPCCL